MRLGELRNRDPLAVVVNGLRHFGAPLRKYAVETAGLLLNKTRSDILTPLVGVCPINSENESNFEHKYERRWDIALDRFRQSPLG